MVSGPQEIMDINAFKRTQEATTKKVHSAGDIAKLYHEHVTWVGGKNLRGASVVDAAITVYNRMLSDAECFKTCLRLEEHCPGYIVLTWKLQETSTPIFEISSTAYTRMRLRP